MADEKTEIPGFYRAHEGTIINKDNEALAAYKRRKGRERELDNLKIEVASIKDDLDEIKNLLKKALG